MMKKELRSTIMKKRHCLSNVEILERSRRIKQRIFALEEFKEAQTILFYVSYGNEVSTHEMITESLAMGKQVIVPKVNEKDHTLCLSSLTKWEDLAPCSYSILEPRPECVNEVPLESIDLLILPGVVFDEQGNRIGHGYGYYDRLLQKDSKAHVLALAFECQIVKEIPTEKHDRRVEKIITEDRVIECS
jgi:5-formyltetrahydrofolate cyclo-ligase